ncbi:MAG: GFA family protein [Candidatus Marinimicrobia bacterium]|nr:GFA family protein [Candidatus Neomarinimicrobiota bacterium]
MGGVKNQLTGSCLCGNVQFSISTPVKWCGHCHCTRCRRSHGAGFVTWVGIEKGNFSVTKGGNKIKWYHSSKKSQYGFCTNCGSSVLFKSAKWKNEIHITLGNIEENHSIVPTTHGYYDTHVDWAPIDDNLKKITDPNLNK